VLALLSAPPPPRSYMASWHQVPVPELSASIQGLHPTCLNRTRRTNSTVITSMPVR
jgi:hypothetical protein